MGRQNFFEHTINVHRKMLKNKLKVLAAPLSISQHAWGNQKFKLLDDYIFLG